MDIVLVLFGWLLGTLSPGVVDAIARRKRAAELFSVIATELHELRYLLAMVLSNVHSKLRTLDQATLDIIKPLLLEYQGDEEDRAGQDITRKLLANGDAAFIAAHNVPRAAEKSLFPIPYDAPFLTSQIPNLGLYSVSIQQRLFRVVRELSLFNEQVKQVQQAHHLTFEGLSPENFKLNAGNLQAGTSKLGYRTQALIKAIGAIVDMAGRPIVGAR